MWNIAAILVLSLGLSPSTIEGERIYNTDNPFIEPINIYVDLNIYVVLTSVN